MTAPPASVPPRSLRSPHGALEHVMDAGGSVVAAYGHVFLQIRYGDLQLDPFERICAAFLRHRMLTPRGAPHSALLITESGVPIPPEAVRVRQRVFVNDVLKVPTERMAVVVLGQSLDASLLRSASRGVVPSHPQLRLFDEPERACAWLHEQVNAPLERLLAAVTEARAMAERARRGERREGRS